ncbi:MAG: helix-turn-helix domain-containing protein [Halanaeroarchaeum sp.]
MSVIVDISLPSTGFELGDILAVERGTRVALESVVPLGDRSVPFVRVFGGRESFEAAVRREAAVDDVRVVSEHGDETLYALAWDVERDPFFDGIRDAEGTILKGTGTESRWAFEVRFERHDQLTAFRDHCREAGLPVEFERLYNPTKPAAGPWYGLTAAQREALLRAVEEGYYAIPREITTKELARTFDVSDQAMTERLRRAIRNLVANTIRVSREEFEGE